MPTQLIYTMMRCLVVVRTEVGTYSSSRAPWEREQSHCSRVTQLRNKHLFTDHLGSLSRSLMRLRIVVMTPCRPVPSRAIEFRCLGAGPHFKLTW